MQFPHACVLFRCEKRGISTIALQNMKRLRRNCMRMCADQIPHCPWGPRLGPAGQVVWLSETAVAFAGAGRASTETGIAFAGENWVFLARFSLALVLPVSMGVVQGRALVIVVSRWPVSVVVEVSLVSPSLSQCVLCAKKFALRAHNGPKLAFSGVLGELFRGWGVGGACRANYFAPASPPLPPAPARHCYRSYGQALRGLRYPPHR